MLDVKIFFSKYYYLTIYIIAKNCIARSYKDSFMGMLWTILTPISQILIYAAIMPIVMKFPSEKYVPFLISSILLWGLVQGSIVAGTGALINNGEVIKRCLISKTIFPLAELAQNLYKFLLAFVVMYLFSCFTYSSFHISIVLLPLYMIPTLITLACFMISLSFVTPYVKDLKEVIAIALNIAFWLTPIVYPITVFPESQRFLFYFNPFYIMINPLASLIYSGAIPSLDDMTRSFTLMVISMVLCYFIHKKLSRNFIYYI